ncbi:MAG TPA: cytochrome c [Myxococcaceae bacterium]|nr:cytochrome c [Myxococcaceae bacterium]
MFRRGPLIRVGLAFLAGLILPALAFFLMGLAGLFPVAATQPPSRIEADFARLVVRRSLAREARGVIVPPAPQEDATLLQGLRTYRRNCAGCHGKFAARSRWGATSFYPRVPQFAEEGSTLAPAEMFIAVKHGIRGTGMGGWEVNLRDEEIWPVVWFLQRLRALPPEVEQAWKAPPQ